jgi:hypothetical protein
MIKKHLMKDLTLIFALIIFTGFVSALDYSGRQKNASSFETLEEARISGPIAVATLEGNSGRKFKSHPVLDGYPKGQPLSTDHQTVRRTRSRPSNTDILVFVEKSFKNKDDAKIILKTWG